jgi:pilus assembly protein CpaF
MATGTARVWSAASAASSEGASDVKLSERLKQPGSGAELAEDTEPVAVVTPAAPMPPPQPEPSSGPVDPLTILKDRAQNALFARLGTRLFDASLSETQLHAYVMQELDQVIAGENIPLTRAERQRIVSAVSDDILGYGPIEQYLADPTVTEVMVNALQPIYIERKGKLARTDSHFTSHEHLRRVIERIVSEVGRRIDESSPMVDARLVDGSRVNAIIPPLALDGAALTIRKFSKQAFDVDDLIQLGTLTPELAQFLARCVEGRLNILVSGGTGTGKTTLLNVLSSMISDDERIVTIEDAAELQLKQSHLVRLETRPPNIEGRGEVTPRDLVRNALRMRPDRIIVGEVRGGEALDMLQAMNTGHDGSLSTLHANAPRDALSRLETMVLMAGIELPVRAIREQAASAIDMLVHLTRLRDGTRRVTLVCEVDGMEGDVVTLSDLFRFDFRAGIDESGRFAGCVEPTGLRPRFAERLQDYGIDLPAALFDVDHLKIVSAAANGATR